LVSSPLILTLYVRTAAQEMGQHILFCTSRILSYASENILLIDNSSTFIFQTKTRNQAFQLDNLSSYDLHTMLPFCVKLEDLACRGEHIDDFLFLF